MALLINIDTANEKAAVSISDNGKLVAVMESGNTREHAAFLHPAIESLLQKCNYEINNIDAIAVTEGPGSYTGLRVGMATAKGLCFALKKPLITIGTLPMMAMAMIENNRDNDILFCPMIDARRMEVFTAVYDRLLHIVLPPCSMILTPDSFHEYLKDYKVLFSGSGSNKWQTNVNDRNALFSEALEPLHAFNKMAYDKFCKGEFSDVAYTQPLYLKDFHKG